MSHALPSRLRTFKSESDFVNGEVDTEVVSGIPGRGGSIDTLLGDDQVGLLVWYTRDTPEFSR